MEDSWGSGPPFKISWHHEVTAAISEVSATSAGDGVQFAQKGGVLPGYYLGIRNQNQ